MEALALLSTYKSLFIHMDRLLIISLWSLLKRIRRYASMMVKAIQSENRLTMADAWSNSFACGKVNFSEDCHQVHINVLVKLVLVSRWGKSQNQMKLCCLCSPNEKKKKKKKTDLRNMPSWVCLWYKGYLWKCRVVIQERWYKRFYRIFMGSIV